MLNHQKAKDEMRSLFKTRFDDYWANGLPNEDPAVAPPQFRKLGETVDTYKPEIKWKNIEKADHNDNGVHWLRFASRNLLKRQKSLAGGRQQAVGTSYTTKGLITVELYFSKSAYQTQDEDVLSLITERCFVQANTSCGVWFRNTIIVELEPEENHFRSNVLTEFEYDSVIN